MQPNIQGYIQRLSMRILQDNCECEGGEGGKGSGGGGEEKEKEEGRKSVPSFIGRRDNNCSISACKPWNSFDTSEFKFTNTRSVFPFKVIGFFESVSTTTSIESIFWFSVSITVWNSHNPSAPVKPGII